MPIAARSSARGVVASSAAIPKSFRRRNDTCSDRVTRNEPFIPFR